MNRKILISGANGFVGGNLCKYFESDINIQIKKYNFRDNVDNTDIEGINSFIHLAGKAHDLSNATDSKEYFDVNYGLTKLFFEKFIASQAEDFIFISSVKAVADFVDTVLSEDTNANPLTAYGQSKRKAEEYLLGQQLPMGKRIFILRPCMIHGPGNKGNLNLLYQFVVKGYPYPLGAFDNRRSFLSIQNLMYVIDKILKDKSIKGGIYNLSDDDPISTNDVINIIAEMTNREAKIWRISPIFIRGIAKIGNLIPFPLNSEKLKKLTNSYAVDNSKIKTELGIIDFPVSSRDGLRMTIKSFV